MDSTLELLQVLTDRLHILIGLEIPDTHHNSQPNYSKSVNLVEAPTLLQPLLNVTDDDCFDGAGGGDGIVLLVNEQYQFNCRKLKDRKSILIYVV